MGIRKEEEDSGLGGGYYSLIFKLDLYNYKMAGGKINDCWKKTSHREHGEHREKTKSFFSYFSVSTVAVFFDLESGCQVFDIG